MCSYSWGPPYLTTGHHLIPVLPEPASSGFMFMITLAPSEPDTTRNLTTGRPKSDSPEATAPQALNPDRGMVYSTVTIKAFILRLGLEGIFCHSYNKEPQHYNLGP